MPTIPLPGRFLFGAIAALIYTLFCGTGAGLAADSWPHFRGPTADGHTADSTAPLAWGENDDNADRTPIAWKTALPGPGASSPIVHSGRVFLTCYGGYGLDPENAGDQADLVRYALCYDLDSGEELWRLTVPNEKQETRYRGPYITVHGYASNSAVTDGQLVYFFLGSSGVIACRLTGEQAWQADVGSQAHAWGSGASPVLFENLLIVNASAESDAIIALDKQTGERVWSVSGMDRAWDTPALVEVADGRTELVVSLKGKIRGLDPATGEELWTCKGIDAAELCPSPIAHNGVAYILGHPGGQAIAVRAGGRGDVTSTHILWRMNQGSNVCSPLYHDGCLYWTSDKKGIAYCVKAETGELVYQERIDPRPGLIYASPVLVQDRIYYVSRQSGTYVIEAKPTWKLLAHNQLPDDASDFTGSPAVVDGSLILRSNRYLYRIGGK
ncbi:outer membrane protein assembly factor BamB family protein [Lignipirellula cremea]|uniref:Outer membrane biogenesis protein BamB n=1 Tax=Lignipirellula cremea TaxID=2528010 RepID=A0A518DZY0_9BACT|nr:PQQ-binding-like beta-propeller repeat protein [Lignipirellula cremea]QDU97371.1 outer membrane biogenesis protein BamB [Lignipirellula cremea]